MIDLDGMSREEQEKLVLEMVGRLSPDGRAKLLEAMAARAPDDDTARAYREKAKALQDE